MDKDEIRKWHSLFKRPDELFEIRIIGERTFSGYFNNVEEAIKAIEPYDKCNIYYTINEVNQACSSRSQFNCIRQVKGTATSKQDIVHRWWVPIDVDSERPSGVSASEEEKEFAHKKAIEVYEYLSQNLFPSPVVCDSSSGFHILIPVDMDNTQAEEEVIKSFLSYLSCIFTDVRVKIDTVLYDANRILRLPGSFGRKGISTEERKHRMAKILLSPNIEKRADLSFFKDFVEKHTIKTELPENNRRNGFGRQDFNIRDFISKHNIEIDKEISSPGGGTKFVLRECPFDSGHKSPDAAIFEMPNGTIGFHCFHNSCSGKTWRDFRLHYEPDAYSKPFDGPVVRQWTPAGQVAQRKPSVKEEIPELGSKWLSMSVIKKLNLDDVEFVATGFPSLDKDIYGLVMGEITILSGSTASGKSSLLNTILLNVADHGWKSAIWSGELPASMLKNWIQTAAAGRRRLAPSKIRQGSFYVPERASTAIDSWLEGRLYIYNNDYGTKWEQIFSDMETLLSHGVRVFVLDNLFTLDIDIFGGDTNRRQKELIIQVKEFAKKNSIHIILVAHPRKTNAFIRRTDISGSSDIANAADNVFIIHRVGNDFMKAGGEFFGHATIAQYGSYGNVIECCKNRLFGVADKLYGLYYDPVSRRFSEDIECGKVYGWEDMEMQIQNKRPEEVPERPAIVPDTSKWEPGPTEYEMGDPDNNFGYPY